MTEQEQQAAAAQVLAEFQSNYHPHAGPIYDHERMAAEIVRLRALVREAYLEGINVTYTDPLESPTTTTKARVRAEREVRWKRSKAIRKLDGAA